MNYDGQFMVAKIIFFINVFLIALFGYFAHEEKYMWIVVAVNVIAVCMTVVRWDKMKVIFIK